MTLSTGTLLLFMSIGRVHKLYDIITYNLQVLNNKIESSPRISPFEFNEYVRPACLTPSGAAITMGTKSRLFNSCDSHAVVERQQ